jgi:hypothetical protein
MVRDKLLYVIANLMDIMTTKKHYSSLGYRPPLEFEKLLLKNHKSWPTALTQSI